MTEANELTAELTAHREACAAKIKEGAETLCGIRTIRQELFQMAGEIPTIQDCEVSEWSRAAPSTGEDRLCGVNWQCQMVLCDPKGQRQGPWPHQANLEHSDR